MLRTRTLAIVVRRLAWLVPVVATVVVVTFGLVHLAPGGPWDSTSAIVGGNVQRLSPVEMHALKANYGLDKPVPVQLALYLRNLARLDLGQSYHYQGESVRSLISQSWRDSAVLGALSFLVALVAGVGLGLLAALKRRTVADHLVTGFATAAASVPSFVTGVVLIIVASVALHRVTHGTFFLPEGGFGLDARLVLPTVTIAALPAAYLARLTRASALDALDQDHVAAARARGVRETAVVVRHVLPNSLVPVISALGPILAHLLTGAVVAEEVFHVPGIGRLLVEAVGSRDYPIILGTSVVLAVAFAVANLAVDLLHTVLEPRMAPS